MKINGIRQFRLSLTEAVDAVIKGEEVTIIQLGLDRKPLRKFQLIEIKDSEESQ